jgi:peptidoglycan/xylan/chitin deacetylase (PgdA/CDA1 family)
MTTLIQSIVRSTDAVMARAYLALFPERGALLTFLFHSLFRDDAEIAKDLIDPLERTTVGHLRQLIGYYLDSGYRFVSPPDLLQGLDSGGKYAMLTFDDGYYNNVHALPVLEEYRVPAVFFISTNHVRQNKCFWWDVVYRERIAHGARPGHIYRETLALKSLRTSDIEAQLIKGFGQHALLPRGDIDRPFTPAELRDFAGSPYVHLGNHTADHAILTNYSPEEVCEQIAGAQQAINDMTGVTPISIAYPNGAHNRQIMQTCAEAGLKVGFTIRPQKTTLPLNGTSPELLRLGRFVPRGRDIMKTQCRTYRSDLQLYGAFRAGYLWLRRGETGR